MFPVPVGLVNASKMSDPEDEVIPVNGNADFDGGKDNFNNFVCSVHWCKLTDIFSVYFLQMIRICTRR